MDKDAAAAAAAVPLNGLLQYKLPSRMLFGEEEAEEDGGV